MQVSLSEMVGVLEEYGGRYVSAVCFSDDVSEILQLSNRGSARIPGRVDESLRMIRPGHFEFDVASGDVVRQYTVHVRKPGIVEVERGHGLRSLSDKCPIPILSVQRAEIEKERLLRDAFLLLKGPEIRPGSDVNWCFLLCKRHNEFEAYTDGLTPWAKRKLWPR